VKKMKRLVVVQTDSTTTDWRFGCTNTEQLGFTLVIFYIN